MNLTKRQTWEIVKDIRKNVIFADNQLILNHPDHTREAKQAIRRAVNKLNVLVTLLEPKIKGL